MEDSMFSLDNTEESAPPPRVGRTGPARLRHQGPVGAVLPKGHKGTNTPWWQVRFARGRGTSAASRAMKSSGSKMTCLVLSRYGVCN